MLNKKAAIEMSMTTIIVIVLGVVLLILGLVFVQFIFKKTTLLAEGAFDKAEGQIGSFSEITDPLTISPKKMDLSKGDTKIVSVTMANKGATKASVKLKVNPLTKADDLICVFEETQNQDSDPHSIPSGEFRTIQLRIESQSTGTTGNKVCKITSTGLGEDITATISIRVQ